MSKNDKDEELSWFEEITGILGFFAYCIFYNWQFSLIPVLGIIFFLIWLFT